jgi:hypothetical protein
MQAKFAAQFRAGKLAIAELRKYLKFNCREQNFGRPESESSLQNRAGINL